MTPRSALVTLDAHSRKSKDFGRIEKRRKKKDRVTLPSEWVNLIKTTDQQKPFRIAFVEHPLTDDMLPDDTPVITVMNYKNAYEPVVKAVTGIVAFRGVRFQLGKTVTSRTAMTADCTTPVIILKRGMKMVNLTNPTNLCQAYPPGNFLAIKEAKYNDVKALLSHVHLDARVTFQDKLKPYRVTMFIKNDQVLQASEVPVKHHSSAPSVQKKYSSALDCCNRVSSPKPNENIPEPGVSDLDNSHLGERQAVKTKVITPTRDDAGPCITSVQSLANLNADGETCDAATIDAGTETNEIASDGSFPQQKNMKKYSSALDCCNQVSSPKPDENIPKPRSSDLDNSHLDRSQAVKTEVIAPTSDDPNAVEETFDAANMDASTKTNEITSDGSLPKQKEKKLPSTSEITASLINQTLSQTAAPALLKESMGRPVTIPYHVLEKIGFSTPFALKINNETFMVDPSCLIYTKAGVKIFIKNDQVLQPSEVPVKHHPPTPSVQKKYSSALDCYNQVSSPKPNENIPEPRFSDLDNSHPRGRQAVKTTVIAPTSDDARTCITGVQSLSDLNAVGETFDPANMNASTETNEITSDGSLSQQIKMNAKCMAGEDKRHIIADLIDSMLEAITCYIDDEQSYGLALKKEKREGSQLVQVSTNQLHEEFLTTNQRHEGDLTTNQLHENFLTTKWNAINEPTVPRPTHAHQADSMSEAVNFNEVYSLRSSGCKLR
ncbi:uncharacterized protein [Watersipora subatra]|uniref:uncharacterized protein n=1 Tax=Watersipora subatra TaxID=2589382 RepID=UPI00355B5654